LSYGVIGNTLVFGTKESRFEPLWDNNCYLIPGSIVTTIGEFGMSREWWRKVRVTCNNGVPKTQETKRRGDHTLNANLHFYSQVAELGRRASITWSGNKLRSNNGSRTGSNPVLTTSSENLGRSYNRQAEKLLGSKSKLMRKMRKVTNGERPVHARVVELVVTLDLGSSIERCVGSSPTLCTKCVVPLRKELRKET
jgi:hypothetical protein